MLWYVCEGWDLNKLFDLTWLDFNISVCFQSPNVLRCVGMDIMMAANPCTCTTIQPTRYAPHPMDTPSSRPPAPRINGLTNAHVRSRSRVYDRWGELVAPSRGAWSLLSSSSSASPSPTSPDNGHRSSLGHAVYFWNTRAVGPFCKEDTIIPATGRKCNIMNDYLIFFWRALRIGMGKSVLRH